jgi:hypothetical protein
MTWAKARDHLVHGSLSQWLAAYLRSCVCIYQHDILLSFMMVVLHILLLAALSILLCCQNLSLLFAFVCSLCCLASFQHTVHGHYMHLCICNEWYLQWFYVECGNAYVKCCTHIAACMMIWFCAWCNVHIYTKLQAADHKWHMLSVACFLLLLAQLSLEICRLVCLCVGPHHSHII